MSKKGKNAGWGTIELVAKRNVYDLIEKGEKKVNFIELKQSNCKKVKGLGLVCPYAMPSWNAKERICQKTGKTCVSGCLLSQSVVRLRRGRTDSTMRLALDKISVKFGEEEIKADSSTPVICLELGKRLGDDEQYPPIE